jgi:hypothetical protein
VPFLAYIAWVLAGLLFALISYGIHLLVEVIGHAVTRWLPQFLSKLAGDWVSAGAQAVQQRMGGALDSGSAAMSSLLSAPALAINVLFTATAQTLWTHRQWMHNILDWYLPQGDLHIQNYATSLYNGAIWYINNRINWLYQWTYNGNLYIFRVIDSEVNMLIWYSQHLYQLLTTSLNQVYTLLHNQEQADFHQESAYARSLYDAAIRYIVLSFGVLTAAIAAAQAYLIGYITSVATFITTVEIPSALVAYTEAMAATIAVVTDEMWPFIFRSLGVSSARLLTSLPTVAARIALVPPEPLPGIPGTFEAVTGALGYLSAVTESATVPLWTKLHDVADEVDGIGSFLLTGGLLAFIGAAIVAPRETAQVVNDVTRGPIDELLQTAVALLG